MTLVHELFSHRILIWRTQFWHGACSDIHPRTGHWAAIRSDTVRSRRLSFFRHNLLHAIIYWGDFIWRQIDKLPNNMNIYIYWLR